MSESNDNGAAVLKLIGAAITVAFWGWVFIGVVL